MTELNLTSNQTSGEFADSDTIIMPKFYFLIKIKLYCILSMCSFGIFLVAIKKKFGI